MMGYTDGKVHAVGRSASRRWSRSAGRRGRAARRGQPYPFFLAHQLDAPPEVFAARLGPVGRLAWWSGSTTASAARSSGARGRVWVWSRGEELVTERFPGDRGAGAARCRTAPCSTARSWSGRTSRPAGSGRPAPFALLQQRIGRKTLTKKVLADAPVTFMAYDLLEQDGRDIRGLPQRERRARLEALLRRHRLHAVAGGDRALVAGVRRAGASIARARRRRLHAQATGRRLRHRPHQGRGPLVEVEDRPDDGRLRAGLRAGGHGRRASLYTDYTFAVWNRAPRDKAGGRRGAGGDRAPGAAAARRAAAGAVRQGLFGPDRRGVPAGRCDHPPDHAREVRPGAQRAADPGVRAGLRGHQPQPAPQERHRRALSAHAAHPRRQAAARGQHPAGPGGAAARMRCRGWTGPGQARA